MQWTLVCNRKKIVLVPTVTPSFSWARHWSSFGIAGIHKSFRCGSYISLLYFVIVSLVIGWIMMLHTSSMSTVCQNLVADSMRVLGMVYLGGALNARLVI